MPIVQCSLYTVTGYSVSVLNNEPANKTTITISNEIRLSDLVTELLPRNNYMIIVSAISIKGLGPPSAPINGIKQHTHTVCVCMRVCACVCACVCVCP